MMKPSYVMRSFGLIATSLLICLNSSTSAFSASPQRSAPAKGLLQSKQSAVSSEDQERAADLSRDAFGFLNKNDYTKAAELLDKSIKLNPNDSTTHYNLCLCLVRLGKYEQSVAEGKRAIALDPAKPDAWFTLASCYQMIGDSKQALAALQKYLALAPNGEFATTAKHLIPVLKVEIARGANLAAAQTDNYFLYAAQSGCARWSQIDMPITVCIRDGSGVPGFNAQFEKGLRDAFNEWQEGTAGAVQFKFVPNDTSARIICSWTDDAKQLVNSAEAGHAAVMIANGQISNVHIVMLTRLYSDKKPMSPQFAHRMALHEIGHALGLAGGHSPLAGDIMFSRAMSDDGQEAVLSERDKKTITMLYGADGDKFLHKVDHVANDKNSINAPKVDQKGEGSTEHP